MSIYLKSLLGLITFFSPVIIGTIHLARKQVKSDRSKGCICSHPYIGLIAHNCPLHRQFYLLRNVYKIPASFGERNPICHTCLTEIMPKGYTCDWPVENAICNECGNVRKTVSIPERDKNLWTSQKYI